MSNDKSPEVDVLDVLDRVLSAALREVRQVRQIRSMDAAGPSLRPTAQPGKRMSQTSACIDILTEVGEPLHVHVLIAELAKRNIQSNRETLASALTKRLSPNGPFVRTAGNTFGLAGRDEVVAAKES
jgi:hypothetical protein